MLCNKWGYIYKFVYINYAQSPTSPHTEVSQTSIWSHAEKLMLYLNAKTQLQKSKPQLVLHKGEKSLKVQLIVYKATTDG